jgi:hypothetical protein
MKTSSWNFAESVMLAFNLKKKLRMWNVSVPCVIEKKLEDMTRPHIFSYSSSSPSSQ